MRRTKRNSWFELIPCTIISDFKIDDKEVDVLQVEETHIQDENGIAMMLCEIKFKEM